MSHLPTPEPSSQLSKSSSSKLPFWIGLGVGVVGLSAGLLVFLAGRGQSQPTQSDWQERQNQVSAVIRTKDRQSLIGDSPTRGPADARIVMFKFSDFQCPYCAKAADTMAAFMDEHDAEVLFVYKNLPLTQIHDQALPAAKAAWAADQQGKFWPYHDGLFLNQDRLGDDLYIELAQQLGLDMQQFNRDRTSEAAQASIDADVALARELNLTATPTFLMNDLLIPGSVPLNVFEDLLTRLNQALEAQPPS